MQVVLLSAIYHLCYAVSIRTLTLWNLHRGHNHECFLPNALFVFIHVITVSRDDAVFKSLAFYVE